jgi:HEAT repeat protein
MEPLSPPIMHKLVFTILVHGLPDSQSGIALDVLLEAQTNPNPQVRELAVVALAELPVSPVKRVAALMRGMQDPTGRVRRRAARALGDFGLHAVPAIQPLTVGLRDPDASVRRDSAGTLGRLGQSASSAVEWLISLLADPDIRTRVVVSTALKRIGRSAVPALIATLNNPTPELRARAATLLGRIAPEDDDVVSALRNAVADEEDAEVRQHVEAALELVNIPMAELVEA